MRKYEIGAVPPQIAQAGQKLGDLSGASRLVAAADQEGVQG
ncbi:hypothetical protein [Inquilinus sp. OTU3971]